MVDIKEAPPGHYAVESQQNNCTAWTSPQQMRYCAFWDKKTNTCTRGQFSNVDCMSTHRKDGASVIFLVDPAATTASTVPVAASHAFQSAQLEKYLQDVEAVLEDIIDGEHAPAGMVAVPATNGCQGCFYLKGKADCVRTSAVSCTALGRPDESNVIFVPR